MDDDANDAAERSAERRSQRPQTELLLAPFGKVYHSETVTVLLLALTVFLLLTAYYILKVVREPLIITAWGAEVKSYSSAAQVLLLTVFIRLYGALAARFGRMQLIAAVTIFFAGTLFLFYLLGRIGVPIGIPFFLWVGIFNLAIIAQFWALANDVYTAEQGRRLFAIVGIGSSVGAVAGAGIARWLFVPLGPFRLLPLAALMLLACLLFVFTVHRRESARLALSLAGSPAPAAQPIGEGSTTGLLLKDRYLQLVALLTLLLNCVSTTGEYILDRNLLLAAEAIASAGTGALSPSEYIGNFRAEFFGWVNLASLLLQLFVVSRLLRHVGVRRSLFVMPVVSLFGYGAMAAAPLLAVIAVAKAAENSINYSLENTALQALFLITSREAKYKAKTAIDTLFWRAGDVLAASFIWLGGQLTLRAHHFIWVNIGLVIAWLVLMVAFARLHRLRSAAVIVKTTS